MQDDTPICKRTPRRRLEIPGHAHQKHRRIRWSAKGHEGARTEPELEPATFLVRGRNFLRREKLVLASFVYMSFPRMR